MHQLLRIKWKDYTRDSCSGHTCTYLAHEVLAISATVIAFIAHTTKMLQQLLLCRLLGVNSSMWLREKERENEREKERETTMFMPANKPDYVFEEEVSAFLQLPGSHAIWMPDGAVGVDRVPNLLSSRPSAEHNLLPAGVHTLQRLHCL